ncbi:hypothetical protein K2X40_01835 [Candidatus Babeliales bacterium]|nr:hypothetical protein [Candidatus Babeliales bacterium]
MATEQSPTLKVSGNILLFYVYDIGDDVDLDTIRKKNFVKIADTPLSPFFKHYHVPLSFRFKDENEEQDLIKQGGHCLFRKVYNFGVISFCYRIPYEESLEDLKHKLGAVKKKFDLLSKQAALEAFQSIQSAVNKPHFANLEGSYVAVQITPLPAITAEQFRDENSPKIASLLRLEMQTLSERQRTEVLSATTSYYGQDMIIVDTNVALIYDDEFFEPLEFFESASIEKLELQYFDRVLDEKLNYFYAQSSYKIPLIAYIPFMSSQVDLPVSRLAKLRVDISVVTERLENSVTSSGDFYFSNFYAILVDRFFIKEWRDSINRKLDIIKDLYTVYQDRLDTIHEEFLSLVIIILIVMEVLLVVR